MWLALAIFCFLLAAIAFAYGFITEWKQSRADGPVAIVATLPFAVQAAILLSFGVAVAPFGKPWWAVLLAFPIFTVVLGKLILMANGRQK